MQPRADRGRGLTINTSRAGIGAAGNLIRKFQMKTLIALALVFGTLTSAGIAHADGCANDISRNALFVHATVVCGVDYMDTPAGNEALAGSKECIRSMSDQQFMGIAKKAMLRFDSFVHEVGIHRACSSVDHIREW
jgi:hypothetical protein